MKPNVGMVYPVASAVSAYTPGTSITYGTGFVIAEARGATVNWERSDAEFYGDDVLLDTDNGVTGYTIDFEPTGLSDNVRQKLLGEVKATSEYSITDAAAPDVGFGYIRVMREDGTTSVETTYEGWWYYKVKFSVSSEETRTKEKDLEWRTPTLSGKGAGVQLNSGDALTFAVHQSFSTMAAAKTWMKSKAGIT